MNDRSSTSDRSSRIRIGLDFDDTLMPTRAAVIELLNAHHGTAIRAEECTEFFFSSRWNMTRQDFIDFFTRHEETIHQRKPLEGMREILQEWEAFADFYVVTARPEIWKNSAEQWLRRYGIPFKQVICVESGIKKSLSVKEFNLAFFIDDRHDFVADIAAGGTPVLLLDAPYNQGYAHPMVERVNNWQEIGAIVKHRRYLEPAKKTTV